MPDKTFVYLITGFLGAGKTTLLNRIIKRFPKDRKLTLLVNEFGEVGVDGTLVEGEEIDMMEISKGSIFCVCVKTDFIKGLYELNAKVKPDVLLIESTGVANPSDLKKDLALPIFNDRFEFKEQFCIIDAAHFLDAYDAYASIEKQIASSSVFVINKTDLASRETVEKIKDLVSQFHPDPVFFETTYGDIPLERFFNLEPYESGKEDGEKSALLSDKELDDYLERLLDSPDLEITPPDILMSATYSFKGRSAKEIEDMAKSLPAGIIRAKGFVRLDGEIFIFNYVMGDWTIKSPGVDTKRIKHENVLVFIGPPVDIKSLDKILSADLWKAIGTYKPF